SLDYSCRVRQARASPRCVSASRFRCWPHAAKIQNVSERATTHRRLGLLDTPYVSVNNPGYQNIENGDWLREARKNSAEDACREVPVPFFFQPDDEPPVMENAESRRFASASWLVRHFPDLDGLYVFGSWALRSMSRGVGHPLSLTQI